MKTTWVQDAPANEALRLIEKFSLSESPRPEGSYYITGEPREEGLIGIYFVDPTGETKE